MAEIGHDTRFAVSLAEATDPALVESRHSSSEPIDLEYLLHFAQSTLLQEHASRQLSFPLEQCG